MSKQLQKSGNYTIGSGSPIFLEGQKITSLDILLKGKVDVYLSSKDDDSELDREQLNHFRIFSIDQNVFLGTIDLFLNKNYSFSYHAIEDSILYAYPVSDLHQFSELLQQQKEYASYTVTSIATMMLHSHSALQKLNNCLKKLMQIADNSSYFFWSLKEAYNLTHMPSTRYLIDTQENYESVKKPNQVTQYTSQLFNEVIIDQSTADCFYIDPTILTKIEYYSHIMNLPLQLKKNFFSADDYITNYHFNEAVQVIDYIKYRLKEVLRHCEQYFALIYNAEEKCIFSEIVCLIHEVKKYDQNSDELINLLNDLMLNILNISGNFLEDYCYDFSIDIQNLLNVVNQLKANNETTSNKDIPISNESDQPIPDELVDSAEKLLRYSGISNDKSELFRYNLTAFRQLKDKRSTDSDTRNIANTMITLYFEIYELVLKKAIAENNTSRLIEMFLSYGYMDEQLLSTKEVLYLYKLTDESNDNQICSVFNMHEWMFQIYSMHKDPSINEFDQDYFDVFREMLKRREVTENDKLQYNYDYNRRVSFEVQNMFETNHKLVYGQPNTYFPILHSDMFVRDLSKTFVSKSAINEALDKILSVDFSAFYREILYQNQKLGIEKELVIKDVPPDIILMPTYGLRGIMWQDIAGRVRSTPGRILLPIFTSENIEDMLIQMIGNYRWELCKTMMGVSWNDISERSLTSEYMDYIQFYKKNKDLSEEAKDKLKVLVLRHNNKMREIFTSDYEIWIKHESKGNIRLNKVARSILFKYCPFAKPLREKLEKQPIFSEIIVPFNNARSKYAKDLENRYNKLLNNDLSKDDKLTENLKFYKEL